MDKYYYVVAQLPLLTFDKEPAITIASFLQETEKWLSSRDYAILSRARYDSTDIGITKPGLLKEYIQMEVQFRTELATWRKARQEGVDYKSESFPASLVKDGNPLEIEKALLKRRWDKIAQVEPDHHFDLEFLILYFFKLQILEQLSLYNKEQGLEIFQKISKVEI
ncbi:DUF2764 family protein [candidate division KSB1 bacterium]|nr:DUF2764 family protein [candidate division KSB1 bacterium]